MELRDAETLAREYMREYGLTQAGWTFRWGRGKNLFGLCSHRKQEISLSAPITALNSVVEVRDTILHEIAHALVPPTEGHGKAWQRKAREIGANPSRTYDAEVVTPEGKYTLECPNCGRQVSRHRKPKRFGTACGTCCAKYAGGQYDHRFAFRWYLTDGMVEIYS